MTPNFNPHFSTKDAPARQIPKKPEFGLASETAWLKNMPSKPFFGNFPDEIQHRLVDFSTNVEMLEIGKLFFEARVNRFKKFQLAPEISSPPFRAFERRGGD